MWLWGVEGREYGVGNFLCRRWGGEAGEMRSGHGVWHGRGDEGEDVRECGTGEEGAVGWRAGEEGAGCGAGYVPVM